MSAPNLFLTYVSDAKRSTAFYSDLFDIEPNFTSPRYVAFEVTPGVLFAIWTGQRGHHPRHAPHDDVFGRTFVIANPDGNLIRVSPVD